MLNVYRLKNIENILSVTGQKPHNIRQFWKFTSISNIFETVNLTVNNLSFIFMNISNHISSVPLIVVLKIIFILMLFELSQQNERFQYHDNSG